MRRILTLSAIAMLALSAPALAQNAGAPGAVGTGGSLTGSNPGTGYGVNGPIGDSINPGPGPSEAYPNSPGNGQRGYLDEGRAAAPDMDNGGYNNGYNGGYNNGGPGINNGGPDMNGPDRGYAQPGMGGGYNQQ